MRELFVRKVINLTKEFLDNNQRTKLKEILMEICTNYQIEILEQNQREEIQHNNEELLNKFISSKEIEGCSNRTLNYYKDNITKMLEKVKLLIEEIKGLDIAKKLNKNRVINSTGTFGLIPANERKVIQEYCKNLVSYDRMKTPNSHKLFSKIVALSLMENMDRDRMNEIISKINQIVKEEN